MEPEPTAIGCSIVISSIFMGILVVLVKFMVVK